MGNQQDTVSLFVCRLLGECVNLVQGYEKGYERDAAENRNAGNCKRK